jgi:hypothetical protein
MSGTGNGLFEPEQSVTRAQVVAATYGILQKARSRLGDRNPLPVVVPRYAYKDIVGHWAESRIAEMSGYCRADQGTELDAVTFRPDDFSTRSHAAGALIRALLCFQTGKLPVWVLPGATPAPDKPVPAADVLRLCESTVASERRSALESLRRLNFGGRALNYAAMPKSHERCVLELLPAALYTNLKTVCRLPYLSDRQFRKRDGVAVNSRCVAGTFTDRKPNTMSAIFPIGKDQP